MTTLQVVGGGVWLTILALNYPKEFWPKFRQEKDYQHLVLATIAMLSVLWSLRAGISTGLDIHFLAITVLTLSHGWRIAVYICLAPTAILMSVDMLAWQDIGLFSLTTVVLPALFSYAVFVLSYHYLIRHLFIYIFVAAFVNGALTIACHLLLTSGWAYFTGAYSWQHIVDNYLAFLPLLLFPEALLNGMAITLLVVYRPQWVRTFSDRDYLYPNGKK